MPPDMPPDTLHELHACTFYLSRRQHRRLRQLAAYHKTTGSELRSASALLRAALDCYFAAVEPTFVDKEPV